jgi:hypothetical protein
MKNHQFFALQCSIWIVGSTAAQTPVAKIGFLVIGIVYLILQFIAIKSEV